jgi:hypothetical protein
MAQWFLLEDLPIRIDARGAWLHGDEPLHPRVAELFARNVRPTHDGRYQVVLGQARQTIVVEDTPFRVKSMYLQEDRAGGLTAVRLSLSDGTEEALNPATLMQSSDHVLYCRIVRDGLSVPCRFAPGQYHSLALHAELDDDDKAYVQVGGARWPLGPYDGRTLPASTR